MSEIVQVDGSIAGIDFTKISHGGQDPTIASLFRNDNLGEPAIAFKFSPLHWYNGKVFYDKEWEPGVTVHPTCRSVDGVNAIAPGVIWSNHVLDKCKECPAAAKDLKPRCKATARVYGLMWADINGAPMPYGTFIDLTWLQYDAGGVSAVLKQARAFASSRGYDVGNIILDIANKPVIANSYNKAKPSPNGYAVSLAMSKTQSGPLTVSELLDLDSGYKDFTPERNAAIAHCMKVWEPREGEEVAEAPAPPKPTVKQGGAANAVDKLKAETAALDASY